MKNSSTKPWQLKDWKDKRREIIKDVCEQCGTGEGGMVLQHLWHPPAYTVVQREIERKVILRLIDGGKEPPPGTLGPLQRPEFIVRACPKCRKRSFSERKTMSPRYRCGLCGHTFETPISCLDVQNYEVRKRLFEYHRRLAVKYAEMIDQEVNREKDALHKRYMSLEDTVTFCKKCAYMMDVHKKMLCSKCKKNFHGLQFKTCFECAKADGRIYEEMTDEEAAAFEESLVSEDEEPDLSVK